ncbi:MAG: transporter [Vicinamibacteria bacterium]|nr:transporter [Vicinamibacteria bacterium]
MLSLRRFATIAALALLGSTASAQTGPMLTPSAFIEAPGHVGLDILGMTIGKEPNYLSYSESGRIHERTRIDGPLVRLYYVPSERAEFGVEFNTQTYAIKDPRYNKTISDWGDATLRAKLGLKKGEVGASPAVATQFEVTLPNTSFGNGLGPNTIRLSAALLVGYKTEKLTVAGSGGLAIQDEPLRAHEQRDFASLSGSIAYKVAQSFEVFVDAGGYFGDGVPGAISKREGRGGLQYQHSLFGKDTRFYVAARRGLVDFQGDWGVVAGLTTHLRSGVTP